LGEPAVIELLGAVGLDWLMIDTEHSNVEPDGRRMEELVRAAQAAGVTPTVRIPAAERRLVAKALDTGAQGLWVPRVESAEQAAIVVDAARYQPDGHRGAAPIVRSAHYGAEDWDAYVERVNHETSIIIIIETAAGVAHTEEIAATPGIDAIIFGQFDFGVDIGLSQADHYGGGGAQSIHPKVLEAATTVLEACQANGIAAGNVAWSAEMAQEWIKMGFRLFIMETDVTMLLGAARRLNEGIGELNAFIGTLSSSR